MKDGVIEVIFRPEENQRFKVIDGTFDKKDLKQIENMIHGMERGKVMLDTYDLEQIAEKYKGSFFVYIEYLMPQFQPDETGFYFYDIPGKNEKRLKK